MAGGSRKGGPPKPGTGLFDGHPDKFLLDEDVSLVPGDDFVFARDGAREAPTESVRSPGGATEPPTAPGPSYMYGSGESSAQGAGVFDEGYQGETELPSAEVRAAYFDSVMRARTPGDASRESARSRVLRRNESEPEQPGGQRVQVGQRGRPVATDDMGAALSNRELFPNSPPAASAKGRGAGATADPSDVPRSRLETFASEPAQPPPTPATPSLPEAVDFNTLADQAESDARLDDGQLQAERRNRSRRPAGAVPSLKPTSTERRFGAPTWVALIALLVSLSAMALITYTHGTPDWQGALDEMTGNAEPSDPGAAAPPAPESEEPALTEAPPPDEPAAAPEPPPEPAVAAEPAPDLSGASAENRRREAVSKGALLVDADRPAEVYVDGDLRGQVPATRKLTLPVGPHKVKIVPLEGGGKPIERDVRVDAGRATMVSANWGS